MMSRLALAGLILIALGNTELQVTPEGDAQSFRISVSVDLVVLHATVRDRKGRFIVDLRQEDLEVFEDGVRQSIRLFRYEDTPVTVGLVVDHSGSMGGKLPEVIAAARTFVRSSSPHDEMFVVNFNENVTFGLGPVMPFSSSIDDLGLAIANTPTVGMTALYDAVVEGLERVKAGQQDKKALIVISDGADNASVHSLDDVLKMAGRSTALIYTIGIFDDADPDRNPKALNRLAEATGGEGFFPGRLSKVVEICESIAREIRHQYTIGYVSNNPAGPGYRRIRVVARPAEKGKLLVRARAGYIAEPVEGEVAK